MNRIETFHIFQQRVADWSNERGLLEGTNQHKQFYKLIEELGEFAKALMLEDDEKAKDGAGDMLVVLTNICEKKGWSLADCANKAWDEIKDRKGQMVNGTFVKEG